jgi:hypothetical protein
MFCESYRQSLMDAAVLGEPPAQDLQMHLGSCAACSTAFAAEQQLYASFDEAMRSSIGENVPASLVPQVRAEILDRPVSFVGFGWRKMLIPATASLALLSLVVAPRFITRTEKRSDSIATASVKAPGSERESKEASTPPMLPTHVSTERDPRAKRHNTKLPTVEPVRVEAGAQAAMAGLIRLSQERPEMVERFSGIDVAAPVTIKPIEVAEIGWTPILNDEQTVRRNEP